jgi:signal transduction histidine kinase/ActR/RegA family two-component response regulator
MATKLNDKTLTLKSTDPRYNFDLFVEPLFVINRSHHIILVNKSAQTTMRLPESEILRQPIEKLLSLTLPAQRKSNRINLSTLEPFTVLTEIHGIEHSATFLPIASVTFLREIKPRPVAVVILQPIASLHPLDHNTVSVHFQLIGQFAMRIAHDLSNAVTSIICNAELLWERLNDELPALEDVMRKSEEIAQFITELKKYGRQAPHITQIHDLNSHTTEGLTRESVHFQLIGQLAMRIAHDLSNAVTSIICNAELLKEQLDDEPPELDDIIRKSEEMAQFITELKKCGRQTPHITQTLDLNSATSETLTLARDFLGRTIQIDFLPCDTPLHVYIDRLRLRQILLSILITSKNAMRSGSITIETGHAKLDAEFTSTHPGARVGIYSRLSVTDRSAGMDSKQVTRIFDLPPPDETFESSQLELPIVYSIVKAFGGYIGVESWLGKGTRYDIYIPQTAPSHASSIARRLSSVPHSVESPESTSINNTLILVADDDLDIQRTIHRYASKAGFQTIFSANGREALASYRQLAAQRNQPTLLIADLGLPGIDGRTLSITIRQEFPSAHILLTSGFEVELINGKTEDSFDFLQKPFDRHSLTSIIERMLSPNDNQCNTK